MTDQDLLRRIRLGEDSTLEYKRVLVSGGSVRDPKRDAFADELAALANSRGGKVILGVDDGTRRIRGIPLDDLDVVERWVREICNDSVRPALDADLLKRELPSTDGRAVPVLCIDVARSLFVHRSPGGYFRRLGSSKREMAPEVFARLFQERSQSRIIRFDESVVPGAAPSDLHYSLTRRFLRGDVADAASGSSPANSPEASEDTLRKLRIVADDPDGNARLTLAGVLLCTPEPQPAAGGLPEGELVARPRVLLGEGGDVFVVRPFPPRGSRRAALDRRAPHLEREERREPSRIGGVGFRFVAADPRRGASTGSVPPRRGVRHSQTARAGRFFHAGTDYALWVTDPGYERRYLAKLDGAYEIGECYLTVSLGEPY